MKIVVTALLGAALAFAVTANAKTETDNPDMSADQLVVPVTVDNFVRAESDSMIRGSMKSFDYGVGELRHLREPTTPDNQPVIRMNQDTLYSGILLDLSKPVMVTLPDADDRYVSMHVVNQDHYMSFETEPGRYELTEDSVGSRFAQVTFRTFVDPNDPKDIERAHAAQDRIEISGGGIGPFEAPDWDQEALTIARKSLSDLATLGFDTSYAFGSEEETRPIDHLIGTAAGWGGLPRSAAFYLIESVNGNDGKTTYALTVLGVPVDAFWSVTVYNADGYLEANDLGVNSYNDITADSNPDGSYTIHYGGCEDGRGNCIPITPGWNYTVRLYSPRQEILDGSWTFPKPEPSK
jgi:hypothetical protein